MGVDLCVIFSHQFDDSNILDLPDLMNADQPLIAAVEGYRTLDRFRNGFTRWRWELWQHPNAKQEKLDIPIRIEDVWDEFSDWRLTGLSTWSFGFKHHICCIHESRNWTSFVDDMRWQTITREFCFALAKVLGSSKAIYCPDSGYHTQLVLDSFHEGHSFEEIEQNVLRQYGLPSAFLTQERSGMLQGILFANGNNAERSKAQDKVYNVYFVDDFSDMVEK